MKNFLSKVFHLKAKQPENEKTVFCELHGYQDETFVCQHVLLVLEEGGAYGFWWAKDSDQSRPAAWCTSCNELVSKTGGD